MEIQTFLNNATRIVEVVNTSLVEAENVIQVDKFLHFHVNVGIKSITLFLN